MIQKSYEKSEIGVLYLIPTPIGNLKDITLRAIDVLKNVDIVYAEDTRTTAILLKGLNISKPISACHMYNENKVKNVMVDKLKKGENIALVSDRGTPLLSDPGFEVSKLAMDEGINVVSLPGPSALLPALNMSGIEANKFLFYGFLNSKDSAAIKELEELKNNKTTIVFYESPHRFLRTIKSMYEIFGNRKISVIREISKLHEEVYRGTLETALEDIKEIKGEIVIVVEKNNDKINIDDLMEEVKSLIKTGISNKDAVKQVAQKYKISKNMLYNKNEATK